MTPFSTRWSRRLAALAIAGGLTLAVAGVAWAVIPDAGTGVIHSCYSKTTGALRVIDTSKGQSCTASESALNWNGRAVNFRGGWSATTAYAAKDAVTFGGGSYVAKVANTNSRPPNSNWTTLASPSYANVFSESNEVSNVYPIILSSNPKSVGQTTAPAPAGNYTVNAQVLVFMDNDAQDIQCWLQDNHGNSANGYSETSGPPDSGSSGVVQTLSLVDAFTQEPANTIFSVQCATANGADPNDSEAVSVSVAATQVAHVVFNGTAAP